MSNATELLRRTLEIWEKSTSFVTDWAKLHKEIRAFLDAEPEAEPVAWIIETELQDGSYTRWVCEDRKRHEEHHDSLSPIIPLYTRPEPARKPMTSNERLQGFIECRDNDDGAHLLSFLDGIRFAEKHHKIGDEE